MFFKVWLSSTESAKDGILSFCESYTKGFINLRRDKDTEELTSSNAEVAAAMIRYLKLGQAMRDPYNCVKSASEKLSYFFRTYSLIYINRANRFLIFIDEDTNAVYNDGYLMVSCGSLPDIDVNSDFETILAKLMDNHIGGDIRIEVEECS